MKKITKKEPGPKPGHRIAEPEFQALVSTLKKTHKELAELCSAGEKNRLTPQAVSYWRTSGHVPDKYISKLAAEFDKILGGRKPITEAEFVVSAFLSKARPIRSLKAIEGRATDGLNLKGHLLDPPPTTGSVGSQGKRLAPESADQPGTIDAIIGGMSMWELIDAIEKRGYEVFIRRKGQPKEGAANE